MTIEEKLNLAVDRIAAAFKLAENCFYAETAAARRTAPISPASCARAF